MRGVFQQGDAAKGMAAGFGWSSCDVIPLGEQKHVTDQEDTRRDTIKGIVFRIVGRATEELEHLFRDEEAAGDVDRREDERGGTEDLGAGYREHRARQPLAANGSGTA